LAVRDTVEPFGWPIELVYYNNIRKRRLETYSSMVRSSDSDEGGRAMKRAIFLGMALLLTVLPAGCGDDGDAFPSFVEQILSSPASDGDVAFDNVLDSFTISHADRTGNVIFGIDESNADLPEFQAFLTFPLDGSNGGTAIPLNAVIEAADIEVHVDALSFATTVPTRLDLVTYPLTGPTSAEFIFPSSPLPFAFRTLDFLDIDRGNFVRIDVTPLMQEAQRRRLPSFQVRFLLDFVPGASGLVTIADSGTATAPLLPVQFR